MSITTNQKFWIGLGITIAIAIAGWTFGFSQRLSTAEHAVLESKITAVEKSIDEETKARIVADDEVKKLIGDEKATVLNLTTEISALTKEVTTLTAQVKILLRKLQIGFVPDNSIVPTSLLTKDK